MYGEKTKPKNPNPALFPGKEESHVLLAQVRGREKSLYLNIPESTALIPSKTESIQGLL